MNRSGKIIFGIFALLGLMQIGIGLWLSFSGLLAGVSIENAEPDYVGGLILLGQGTFFLLIGGLPLLWYFRKNSQRRRLLETGTPIQTKFDRIVRNRAITINGENPYVIISTKPDPLNKNRIWEFKSKNLWYNPKRYLQPDMNITVYIEQDNYKKYAMDMSHLPTEK